MNENILKDKDNLIKLAKTHFDTIITESFKNQQPIGNGKNIDDILMRWVFLKLNILLKNQFNNDLFVEQNIKIDGLLASRNYDIAIRSKKLNKVILVISLNKILNNINKNFYNMYKDTIFNTVNLGTKNIPYYSLYVSPLNNINEKGINEIFSIKNLLRVYNGNKATNISGITKIVLFNGTFEKNDIKSIEDTNTFLNNQNIGNALNSGILIPDMKFFFSDVYSILQKYN